jgi:flagellar motility protein MotE (MotC chaperone)
MAYPTISTDGAMPGFAPAEAAFGPVDSTPARINVSASPETLHRYADAISTVQRLNAEQVRAQLPASQANLASAQHALASANQLMATLERKLQKESKDLEKVRARIDAISGSPPSTHPASPTSAATAGV